MRLTTRGKLAVTAITDVALHSHGRPVALPGISVRQGISLSYLEDIFSALRRAGLVRSIRGPGGGYMLSRAPQGLSVAEIIMASEKYMPSAHDKANGGAPGQSPGDMTADLWASFHSRVMEYLQSITLADLLAQQRTDEASAGPPVTHASTSKDRTQRATKTQLPAHDVPNSVFALGLG
ncbi:MAG: Rrf2 family transcriptional regulator [Comamonadaceae bacterium]|nr:Rrf2 family transcriptional regulator [Pseudomonadota bacterium]MBS0609809.1 Rrf2 family transcriptional regulator [Pseudomonadota bacterium]MDE2414791.1 Rrf2 family transcriptional regulator [Comamonadaceae bacterium]